MRKILLNQIVFLIILFFGSLGGRAQIYVSTTGDDGNDGTQANPKLTIQAAIDIATSGQTIHIEDGTYTLTSGIIINKSLSLIGNGGDLNNKPLITGGDVANKALIYVSASDVTISNLHLRFQESNFNGATTTTTAGYGIKSSATGTFNNLTITDNLIEGTNPTYVFNSAAIFLGVLNTNGNDKVTILRNTVGHTVSGNALGRAVRASNIYGNIEDNDFKGHYATLQVGDPRGGALIVNNNTLQGKLAMNGYVSAGNKITNNTITSGGTADANGQTGADRQPALIEIISTTNTEATVEVSGNTLNDFKLLGIGIFYSSNISVINNILNPLSGSSNTIGLYFDTKTTNTGNPGVKSFQNLIVKQNTFNAPASSGTGNIGIKFANSYGDASTIPLSGAVIGGLGTDANTFDAALDEYIHLDDRPAGTKTNTDSDPLWTSAYYSGTTDTDIFPFSANVVAEYNVYGAIDTRTDRTETSLSTVKTKIYDKEDAAGLGLIIINYPVKNVNTSEGFATIQEAIDAAGTLDNHVIQVLAGTYDEKLVVSKKLTFEGPNAGKAGTDITRTAEAKIIPPAINFTTDVLVTFSAGSAGSVFDGFEVNGNNPSLISGVTTGGEDVDISYGIGIEDAGDVTIQNNIVKNYGSSAGTPQALGIYVAPNSNAVYSGVVIQNNYVSNIYQSAASAALVGIYTYGNAYAQIKNNKVENVRTGIQFDNPNAVNPNAATFEASIDNNEIIAARGIYYNLAYNTASPWYVRNNTITSAPLVAPSSTFIGIRVESIEGAYSGYITDNTINGLYDDRILENASFDGTGIWFNNKVNTTGTLLFKNNDISNVNNGIVYNSTGTNELTTNVRFVGGNIHDIEENYVKYIIPSGTPTFADINLPSTQLDGKTGEEWEELGELPNIYAKIIDKDDDVLFGKVNLVFDIKNITQGTAYTTIQAANDDVLTQSGDEILLSLSTYTEDLILNKNFTLNSEESSITINGALKLTGDITTFLTLAKPTTVTSVEFAGSNIKSSSTNTLSVSSVVFDTSGGIPEDGYVDGPLEITGGASAYFFPVGKNGVYSVLAVNTPTAPVKVEYFNTAPGDTDNIATGSTLTSVINNEYWNVESTGTAAQVALITLDIDESGIVAPNDVEVAFYGSTNEWVSYGRSSSEVNGDVFRVISNDPITSLNGKFTFGATTEPPLPVELISFTAKATTSGAVLSWSTAAEQSNAKFIIEKSIDGQSFYQLTEVYAQGSGNYSFTDKTFTASAYYKLTQVDANGKATVYEDLIRFVKFGNDINIYPNPVLTVANVSINETTDSSVILKVTDAAGNTVKNLSAKSGQLVSIDFSNDKPGVYIIQISGQNGTTTHKVIKQ